MPKVHVLRKPTVDGPASASAASVTTGKKVTFNRMSIVYSFCCLVNLVAMPLKAYITEFFPWEIQQIPLTTYDSYDAYTNATLGFLQATFNTRTLDDTASCVRNTTSNTHMMRRTLHLPPTIPPAECTTYLIRFPGAFFYGRGTRDTLCNFLAADVSTRVPRNTNRCEHVRLMSFPLADACTWIEAASGDNNFVVYHASIFWENYAFSWCKLVARCLFGIFILHETKRRYFGHCHTLVTDLLATTAADPKVKSYEVFVGDPTFVILSNPWVSLVLVVDVWLSAAYIAIAIFRVSQFTDWGQFFLGCFYGSRTVWFAYFNMRYATYAIKRWRVEEHFASIDPGVMAIAAFVYAGPFLSFLTNTTAMTLFHFLWSLLLPPAMATEAIEIFTGLHLVSLRSQVGRLRLRGHDVGDPTPPILSLLATRARTAYAAAPVGSRVSHTPWIVDLRYKLATHRRSYSTALFNDLKQRVVHSCCLRTLHQAGHENEGGNVYHLYDESHRYKRLPLFSHRGADCFVACHDESGAMTKKLRLSLLACVDLHANDPIWRVPTCETAHKSFVARLNTAACSSFEPTSVHDWCVHLNETHSPWVL
ncbi:Aste57867_24267 [Aphanomyces stellatus]|uniref:Aste57867_24267 protein n=1 Tax=Aphanomyces stellatus TaxID=120398 RepID=A0A485LRS2_9STRA|nr:hypothetical protein As57867_024192 [Aphanomyces stellatus]VFU00907.1 Aste57867_24267 [Aphanomyces stellatus]